MAKKPKSGAKRISRLSHEHFLNRELQALEFNRRVLAQAEDRGMPLLERLKFLCIVSSNLDEFFEIRVSGLKEQIKMGAAASGPDGLTPLQVFRQVAARAQGIVERQYRLLNEQVLPALAKQGIRFMRRSSWSAAQQELAGFRAQAAAGEIDLSYFDGAGFTLDPCVPYAWQTVGETIEIPAATSDRFNVLAFFSLDHRLQPFVFENVTITSELVIACFDHLCQCLTKPTLVVIDQAPVHTSDEFQARLEAWEACGLYVYPIPAYSPELNLIEILWRMIKYHWLPLKAYESFKALGRGLYEVLKGVGSKYQIEFAK